jgi:hypothetical protein
MGIKLGLSEIRTLMEIVYKHGVEKIPTKQKGNNTALEMNI